MSALQRADDERRRVSALAAAIDENATVTVRWKGREFEVVGTSFFFF